MTVENLCIFAGGMRNATQRHVFCGPERERHFKKH